MKPIFASSTFVLLASLVAGCGGGGDDTRTGAIDASFGSAGLSVAAAESIARGTTAWAVAGDAVGRVWATGTTSEPGNAIHARLRGDGLADGTFGTGGRLLDPASLSTNAGEAPSGRGVFPLADEGALFVSAQYRASCFSGPSCGIAGGFRTVTDAKVLRVDGAGRPVAAYGASGVATVPFEIFLDATSIAPGEVAVLGEVQRLAGQLPAPIVAARLDTVGRRNTAWEANASGAFDCPGFSPANRLFAKGAATLSGGLVVVQTFHTGVGSSRLCVSRLLPDGRPDPALANPRGTIIDETIAADGLLNLQAVFANADGTAEAVFGFVDNTASPPFSFAVVAFTREGRIDRARFGAGAFARERRPVALATARVPAGGWRLSDRRLSRDRRGPRERPAGGGPLPGGRFARRILRRIGAGLHDAALRRLRRAARSRGPRRRAACAARGRRGGARCARLAPAIRRGEVRASLKGRRRGPCPEARIAARGRSRAATVR
jgi:hypothetical protein